MCVFTYLLTISKNKFYLVLRIYFFSLLCMQQQCDPVAVEHNEVAHQVVHLRIPQESQWEEILANAQILLLLHQYLHNPKELILLVKKKLQHIHDLQKKIPTPRSVLLEINDLQNELIRHRICRKEKYILFHR